MAYVNGSKQRGGSAYRQHQTLKEFVRKRDGYTCQACGEPAKDVDHIIPFAISHDSTLSNLQVLCRACNLAKRRKQKNARPTDYEAYLRAELAKCG